jgi:hypothetical protein
LFVNDGLAQIVQILLRRRIVRSMAININMQVEFSADVLISLRPEDAAAEERPQLSTLLPAR